MQRNPAVFLTAQWLNLVVVNYDVDARLLAPHVPAGTELDLWQDRALVSLVGFEFRDTRVCGCAIPFHRNFDEVNLRFYVRRRVEDGWRRGVCFVRELVPRRAVTWVARYLYGENYATVPMGHALKRQGDAFRADYWWRWRGRECRLALEADGEGRAAAPGTLEEFIIEHYWGYSGGQRRATVEYEVEHPPWKLWPARSARFTGDVTTLYGEAFAGALSASPASAFFADGSPIKVYRGTRLEPSVSLAEPHQRPPAGAFADAASRYT